MHTHITYIVYTHVHVCTYIVYNYYVGKVLVGINWELMLLTPFDASLGGTRCEILSESKVAVYDPG